VANLEDMRGIWRGEEEGRRRFERLGEKERGEEKPFVAEPY